MIEVGVERIIVQGRIWLRDAYLKIKALTDTGSSGESFTSDTPTPTEDYIYFYAKEATAGGKAAPWWKDETGTEYEVGGTAGGGSPAPTDADYLVKTAHATLTAERVVTDGASITADWTTPGQVTFNVADDGVTNAKLANMAAWTYKIRNAGSTGDPSDAALADFTTASPATGDFAVGFNAAGAIRKFDVGNFGSSSAAGGHLHGMMRVLGDGATTTFDLLDIAEYLEHVGVGGSFQDPNTFTLSSDGSQITFDAAPGDDAVIALEYVIAGI
jgi:hypothetical protein